MALVTITYIVALLAAISSVGLILPRYRQWKKLSHIPGPAIAGWSKIWLLRHVLPGRLCKRLEEVTKTYGPIARVGPDWVVCSDPAEIRRIWGIRSGYYRASWYKATRLDPDNDNVLTLTDNKAHHYIRSRLLPGYSGKGMHNQEEMADTQIHKLIQLLERKYLSTPDAIRPCNLARTMQYLTQDVITAVGFGQAAGYLDVDEDMFGVIQACETVLLPVHVISFLPILRAILSISIVKPFLPKPTDRHGVGRFLGVIKDHCDRRFGDSAIRRNDILQTFVDSDLTRKQVESEALVTLFGGTDTTATGLRNIIFFLTANANAYRTLQSEIDTAVKTAARPIITDEHAKSLPYLQACIREGLRMWPPSMGIMGKVSDDDDEICGKHIPAGTQVGWAALAIMHDKKIFGGDADVYEPRRWLDAEPGNLKEMEAIYGLVFATGTRWECLGKRLAYVEMGKFIFELFCRFDMSMISPMEPFKWVNHGLTAQHDMNIRFTRRQIETL
ncbi:Cytochrome P450 family protein [Metarhizium guizhouense ARSEF 977]|uniref:Cytochrome P450 family protein n=1 Tax=Metarhizium guizhouense (strain ARSEF 977) TaxID=1276136 RepID=A0A0B4GVS2_METGA|nr:Cytochrome P450 family protein [Metarhizium guizhouense ARSEF 977]